MGLDPGKLPVMEEFVSIQGEGRNIGRPYYFIRVGGCPLRCNFCDTERSWTLQDSTVKSVEDLVNTTIDQCSIHQIEWVSITGGEPMIYQKPLMKFMQLLKEKGKGLFKVHIETSGRFYDPQIHSLSDIYSPDAKTPCTGETMEGFFKGIHSMRPRDQVKCLISNEDDLNYAYRVNRQLDGVCPMILQPFNCDIPTDSIKNMNPIAAESRLRASDAVNVTVLRRSLSVSLAWLINTYTSRCSQGETWKNVIITPQIHVLAFGNQPRT